MQDQYFNKRISFLSEDPQNVCLMPCSACKIPTNHHRTESGLWVCWCGNVDEPQNTAQAVLRERRDAILQALEEKQVQPTPALVNELAQLNIALGDAGQDGAQ